MSWCPRQCRRSETGVKISVSAFGLCLDTASMTPPGYNLGHGLNLPLHSAQTRHVPTHLFSAKLSDVTALRTRLHSVHHFTKLLFLFSF